MTMVKNFALETEGYHVAIVGKNLPLSDTIRNYIKEKLSKVERFSKNILDILVTLEVQKLQHTVTILMNFSHFHIKAHATTDNLYSAIDKASDRLVRLISKYKEQLQEKHTANVGSVDLKVNVLEPQRDEVQEINTEIEAENWRQDLQRFQFHEVVSTEKMSVPMLTQQEAIMRLELSDAPFLIYKAEEDQKWKIIYRRNDENFGIVEIDT